MVRQEATTTQWLCLNASNAMPMRIERVFEIVGSWLRSVAYIFELDVYR